MYFISVQAYAMISAYTTCCAFCRPNTSALNVFALHGQEFCQGEETMPIREQLLWALIGWLVGIGSVFAVGLVILPIVLPTRAVGGEWILFGIVLLIVSPFALLGGWVGGRLPREGGRGSQRTFAALSGLLLSMPATCITFWYAGW
jgi:hypothetical protein